VEQLRLATYGIAAPVERLQSSTGTKDKITQHWIDILIPKAQEMKASQPSRTAASVSEELLRWLITQTIEPFNPLLSVPRMYYIKFDKI